MNKLSVWDTVKGGNKYTEKKQNRIIMAVDGGDKSGKTHFSLTAPEPIAFLDLDNGLEGVRDLPEFNGKDISVIQINMPIVRSKIIGKGTVVQEADDLQQCEKEWEKFYTAFMDALGSVRFRSIVIDPATLANELLKLARFGKTAQIQKFLYTPINSEFQGLFKAALRSDKNVLFLHREKAVYIGDVRTKDTERAGFSGTGYEIQAAVRTIYDKKDQEFKVEMSASRVNMNCEGELLIGVECSFPYAAQKLLPKTTIMDWM